MADKRLTMVINLSNAAISQYTNFDFNSFAMRPAAQPQVYAANSDGLYEIEVGNLDESTEIDCYLKSMKVGMNDYYQTNFLRGYLNYRATDDVEVKCSADGWESHDHVLITNYITDGTWHSDFVDLDTGMWGNQWQFKISNQNGGDLSVRAFNLITAARKNAPVFTAIAGLNNRIDPALIAYNPRTGVQEMAEIVNMYVDDSLHAHRRKGYRKLVSGSFHSLWCGPQQTNVYCAMDSGGYTAIYRVMPDGSGVGIRNGLTQGKIWWTWYDGRIYYTNGHENGYIVETTSYPWVLTPAHASEVTVQKAFYPPPSGSLMATYHGRIYMAQGDTLWYSEYGSPGRWRLATEHFRFEGEITMLATVYGPDRGGEGLYISDGVRTYFINRFISYSGHSGTIRQAKVVDYPAIAGTVSTTDGSRILDGKQMAGIVAVWASTEGICVGDGSGNVRNLTEKKLTYPVASDGAGVVLARHGQTPGMPVLYITSLAP